MQHIAQMIQLSSEIQEEAILEIMQYTMSSYIVIQA